jgi:hypothetical protein
VTPQMRLDALRSACESQNERAKLAKQGFGVDRHLYGLYNLALAKRRRLSNYEMPRFFDDDAFGRLFTSVSSTHVVVSDCDRV